MSILKIDLVSKLKGWFYTKSEVDSKLQSLSSDAVNVMLSLDKYNCNVGDTVTVTVTVTGGDGVGGSSQTADGGNIILFFENQHRE